MSDKIDIPIRKGLCWRCEHRISFLELGHGPRCECQEVNVVKYSCYCYRPVKPVILKKQKGDKRPQFGPVLISARSEYGGEPDLKLVASKIKGGSVLLWEKKCKGKTKEEAK